MNKKIPIGILLIVSFIAIRLAEAFAGKVNSQKPPVISPYSGKTDVAIIADIPVDDYPAKGIKTPSWLEAEKSLPALKDAGVNTIFIWAPYEHTIPHLGEEITAYTDKGNVTLKLGYNVNIKDYLTPDSQRGSEEEFLHMIQTAHSLGMKVMAQLQVSFSNPGNYIYDNHPEWIVKSVYGKPAVIWPWPMTADGFRVDKSNPGLIKYVTETILPYWIRKWELDGVYLDSPAVATCDLKIKSIYERVNGASGYGCITPVEASYSPEPLVKAMKEKITELEKEEGKHIVFAAESTPKSWQDVSLATIISACKGNAGGFQTDTAIDRSLGSYFSWVMGYNFRGMLKNVFDGGAFSFSEKYVSYFAKERKLDEKYARTAKFVNVWINPEPYLVLLKKENAGNYITLDVTAPGKIVFIGGRQLPPQADILEKKYPKNYDSKEIMAWYKGLAAIKKSHFALQSENIENALISPDAKRFIAYNRWENTESATIIVNAGGKAVDAVVGTRFAGNKITVRDLISGELFVVDNPGRFKINTPAYSSRILVINSQD